MGFVREVSRYGLYNSKKELIDKFDTEEEAETRKHHLSLWPPCSDSDSLVIKPIKDEMLISSICHSAVLDRAKISEDAKDIVGAFNFILDGKDSEYRNFVLGQFLGQMKIDYNVPYGQGSFYNLYRNYISEIKFAMLCISSGFFTCFVLSYLFGWI